MDDGTPIYDALFEMQMNLCERFSSMTPLSLRKERTREVFRLIVRYAKYAGTEKKRRKNGRIIRKPAGDNWF